MVIGIETGVEGGQVGLPEKEYGGKAGPVGAGKILGWSGVPAS